jgi:hypothetical protein
MPEGAGDLHEDRRMTELVRYDAMCRAIAEAYEVDEVKDIRDKAIALETYARQAHNIENERQACLIRLRAERKCGELLKQIEMAKGGQPYQSDGATGRTPTLVDRGISRDQSSRWQKLADVPADKFEAALADPDIMPTTSGILQAEAPKRGFTVSDDGVWLWGELQGLVEKRIDRPAEELMATMEQWMRDDVRRWAPMVARWFMEIGQEEQHGGPAD